MGRTMVAFSVICLLAGAAKAAETDTGKALYTKYCGACHGPEAKGDGLAGTFMRPKPPDLTTFAKRNGGTFPERKVMEIIDGRNTVRAHGDPLMPVWGEIFHEEASWDVRRRTDVQEKIRLITEYLASIQAK
jgi:mono/diheme cytochrome c family protein